MFKRKNLPPTATAPAPLTSIAFLLLIFYLLTTTINIDQGIRLTLPAKGAAPEIASPNLSSLVIGARGEVLLDGQIAGVPTLREIVRAKLRANDKLLVSVQAEQATPYGVYVAVLDQLKQAGVSISLAAPERFRKENF